MVDDKIKRYLLAETSGKVLKAKPLGENGKPDNKKQASSFPDEQIRDGIDLFYEVLMHEINDDELSGVGERIARAINSLVNDKHDKDSLSNLFPALNKIEQYSRKTLLIINKERYYGIYNRKDPSAKGFAAILDGLKLPLSHEEKRNLGKLRNIEDHACVNWTVMDFYSMINQYLCAYLRITLLMKDQIVKALNKNVPETVDQAVDFTPYAKNLTKKLKDSILRVVELDTEENIQMLDIYASEASANSLPIRKGTIRSLMQSMKEKRMILWGDAGAGKTTSIEYLAYMDAKGYIQDNSMYLPVVIYLGTTTNEHLSIWDYIIKKLDTTDEVLTELLQDGHVHLYFDGFNEIPMTERNMLKAKRRRELTELINDYPATFMIFTNRPQDGREFANIPVFNILGMNDNQVSQFIEKNAVEKGDISKINDAIASDENLRKMASKPLMLKSLLFIVKTMGEIPKREGLIIDRYLKALFIREKQEKYDEYLDERKVSLLLRRIGYESLESKQTNSGLSEEELLDIMNNCQKDYNFTYDNMYTLELIVHLGIMEKRDDTYVFAHQSYQDYYHSLEMSSILGL